MKHGQARLRAGRSAAALALGWIWCGVSVAAEPAVPPGAAALGYTVCVLNERPTAADIAPEQAGDGNYKWFNGTLWDGPPPRSLYSTVDGVLAIKYDAAARQGGCLIGTPLDLSQGALPWLDGSKGFYIEFDARLSDNDPHHWPALWVMPVEHCGGNGHPARDLYEGDAPGYERWMELDVDEGGLAKTPGGVMCSVISWTGIYNQGGYKNKTLNSWATGRAINRMQVHTFGAAYDPFKRQVTSWVDGVQQWQTPEHCESVPEIASRQHFYPILSLNKDVGEIQKSYFMYVSGVRAYAGTNTCVSSAKREARGILTEDLGWCTVTCPQAVTPGRAFEVRLHVKNPREITRDGKANKLAVNLWWSTQETWGGYLDHFASAEVGQDGDLILKGKCRLNDKAAKATSVQVGGYLTDDWSNDRVKAAEFMGPKLQLVR